MPDDQIAAMLRTKGLDLDHLSDPAVREGLSLVEAALVLADLIDVIAPGEESTASQAVEARKETPHGAGRTRGDVGSGR